MNKLLNNCRFDDRSRVFPLLFCQKSYHYYCNCTWSLFCGDAMGSFQSSELTLPETLGQHVERQYHQLQRRQRGFLTLFEVAAMRPTKELPADPADIATLFALDRKKTGKISLQVRCNQVEPTQTKSRPTGNIDKTTMSW